MIVTTQSTGLIQHWHVASGKLANTIKEDTNLYALDFSHDGGIFAAAGSDKHVHIYDEATHKKVHTMLEDASLHPGHSNRIFALKFHPQDPNILLSGGWDHTIQIYDMRTGMIVD